MNQENKDQSPAMTLEPHQADEVLRIARQAGHILLEKSKNLNNIEKKADGSGLVTEADKASEEFIISQLQISFPDISFLAEESGETLAQSSPVSPVGLEANKQSKKSMRWIIDPLDGTNNYAHGFPWYCVSIGLEVKDQIVFGCIYQPVLKEMFYASLGQGSYLNGKRINVSSIDNLSDALLTVGFYYYRDSILKEEIERFGRVHQQALGIRRPGSAALDMAYVAAGRLDGFWEKGLNAWDVAAGAIIALEAGAKLTDYSGLNFSVHGRELLLTNGLVHEQLMSLLLAKPK